MPLKFNLRVCVCVCVCVYRVLYDQTVMKCACACLNSRVNIPFTFNLCNHYIVAQLEAAAASSPEVFHRAVSSVATRDELPSRRRVKLHRAMLQVVPHALLPQMAARGDAESARLLVACLDSPAGVYAVGRCELNSSFDTRELERRTVTNS